MRRSRINKYLDINISSDNEVNTIMNHYSNINNIKGA